MKPTAELSHEHQSILRMIRVLERIGGKLEAGGTVDVGHLERAIDFIKGFADRCHHGKEEDFLFPAMEKAGVPCCGGPLGVMLREHAEGRCFVRGMAWSAAGAGRGDPALTAFFVENARGYAALLRQHIGKEDRVLFPMADARLAPERQKELQARFAEVEEKVVGPGKHEEYHRLLRELEAAYPG
jgi:hemerythrin-like domain-containing protein